MQDQSLVLFVFIFFIIVAALPEAIRNAESLDILWAVKTESTQNISFGTHNFYLKGVLAFRQHQYERAAVAFQKTDLQHSFLSRWFLAQALLEQGNWKAAINVFHPQSKQDSVAAAAILYKKWPEQHSIERQDWEMLMQSYYPLLALDYARQILRYQEFAQAENVIRYFPKFNDSSDAQIVLGQSFFYRNELDKAEQYFHRAYLLVKTTEASYWYGRVLRINGNAKRALPFLQEASKETGSIVTWYLYELSLAYMDLHLCGKAKESIEVALSWKPDKETRSLLEHAKIEVQDCQP